MQTNVTFDNGDTARISYFKDLGNALYDFGDQGKIHVQPGFFGQPDRLAVAISLGRPPQNFPLAAIDDPAARQHAADHLAQIAQHFHSTFA
ncbi:hypothetical protein AB0E82_21045 [Streptomyces anulatus]|uniref:hypothetical protein n=1 Tax=Streptomyces anulatus TaxID=1892 RepID=UPI0033FB96CC